MTAGPVQKAVVRPARGTRPSNRRQLIIDAATDLFCRKGYANVAMGDVAEAVAIGPSALYRHFHGKQDLLATVVGAALDTLDDAFTTVEDERLDDFSQALAAGVLRHRGVGVLWHRESRQLAAADRRKFRAAIDRIAARFAALIRARRPALEAVEAELLAWSGLAVATSVSLHSLVVPEPEFTTLLSELISTVVHSPLPPLQSTPTRATPGLMRNQTRRETILTEATKLFAANGFAGVSTEDIGASVGISGPSVYNHFPTKSDILLAAMLRGDEWLRLDVIAHSPRHRILAIAESSARQLLRLRPRGTRTFSGPRL
jgi:AcrR family transcriptional regulator